MPRRNIGVRNRYKRNAGSNNRNAAFTRQVKANAAPTSAHTANDRELNARRSTDKMRTIRSAESELSQMILNGRSTAYGNSAQIPAAQRATARSKTWRAKK